MKTRFAGRWPIVPLTPPRPQLHRPRRVQTGHLARWLAAGVTCGLVCLGNSAPAATLYVWQGSPIPTSPYTNWATAATNIQDAVDAAVTGDQVVVTNGTYATGGRAVYGTMTNRVAVDKPLAVRSVNGPQFTVIQGRQVPGTTNGNGAVRCVYLTDGASLSGFTLTNGATRDGGDRAREQSGGGVWCERAVGVVSNCVVVGNSAAYQGGGTYYGTLNNCTLTGNFAADAGGAAYYGRLDYCTLVGNSSAYQGGGSYGATLNNCTLTANVAYQGAGAFWGTLNNSVLTGNSAASGGGGAYGATLKNCTLTGNSATVSGGGVLGGTLNNCIVYFNTAPEGDNSYGGVLNFCCTPPQPNPSQGVSNITVDPQLASAAYLSPGSPCRGAGSAAYASGTDIDGEPWATPPSIGCDEYRAGAVSGPMTVSLRAQFTNVVVGYPVALTAAIVGRTSGSSWRFGDGSGATNQPFTAHTWTAPGDYEVILSAFNENHPGGVSTSVTVRVVAERVHYVAAESANPLAPYLSWQTAARSIQDAVDASVSGALVLVSNGVYAVGGRAVYGIMTNRVVVDRPLTLRSVSGPQFTVIQGRQVPGTTNGNGAIRCVYLTNGASLSGFTLTNGATRTAGDRLREQSGGGLWCEPSGAGISNCVLAGNSAYELGGGAYGGALDNCVLAANSASYGGGACSGFRTLNNCTLTANSAVTGGGAGNCWLTNCVLTGNSAVWGGGASDSRLNNCTVINNSADSSGGGTVQCFLADCLLSGNTAQYGGGASGKTLDNCTLTGNSATVSGGGVSGGTINNCIVYLNDATNGANYFAGTLSYCCTTPLPTNGVGNITNAPMFVDFAGGNLRLQSNSSCINAGSYGYAPGTDLDGRTRVVGTLVDLGAYEFQGPGMSEFIGWLQHYGLSTDGSADATDPDADLSNTFQEWVADTNPTNAASVLRIITITPGPPVAVTFLSSAARLYTLHSCTDLSDASWAEVPGQADVPGIGGWQALRDTNAAPARFYRVSVRTP